MADELILTWTPEPPPFPADDEAALILSQEHLTDVMGSVTVQRNETDTEANTETAQPRSVRWSAPEGLPPNMHITTHNAQEAPYLEITVADWAGLFPIVIEYMQDGAGIGLHQTPHTTDEWETVPAATSDVYAYRPSSNNVWRLPLIVEALASSDASEPAGEFIEQVTYTITVYANYSVGRNALKETVQTRIDATRP